MTAQFVTDAKGNFYTPFESDLVVGYMPADLPKINTPVLRWRGPKIDLWQEWYPMTSFMFDYQKHEVMLRLLVTADRSQIVIRPLTQIYGTGMSVKEAPTPEDRQELVALGLTDIGSVHSHCTGKAFASGTDVNDEKNWPGGLHVTIGNLDEARYDIHARFAWDIPGLEEGGKVVRKAQRLLQSPNLRDWFSLPPHVEAFLAEEEELERDIMQYLLVKPMDAEYPAWWKEKLIEPPRTIIVSGAGGGLEMFPEMNPEIYFKKPKGKKKPPNEDFARRRWACWQAVMKILSEFRIAKDLHWTVDDFKPELRHKLIGFYPEAGIIWEKIEKEILKQFNLSEQDLFDKWDWDIRQE